MPAIDIAEKDVRRILVVEDEFLIAEDIASILEVLGYQVVGPAPTVPAALGLIAREKLDLALLDVNLGRTTSAPIAAELFKRHLPFIVVTGYGDLQIDDALLQAAPRIRKPFRPADFADALAKIPTS